MSHALRWMCAALLAGLLAACGTSDDAKTPKSQPQATVFDDTIAAKARVKEQTEQAMQQNKERLEATMKAAEETGAKQ